MSSCWCFKCTLCFFPGFPCRGPNHADLESHRILNTNWSLKCQLRVAKSSAHLCMYVAELFSLASRRGGGGLSSHEHQPTNQSDRSPLMWRRRVSAILSHRRSHFFLFVQQICPRIHLPKLSPDRGCEVNLGSKQIHNTELCYLLFIVRVFSSFRRRFPLRCSTPRGSPGKR